MLSAPSGGFRGQGGYGLRPHAFDNPEGAPRLRKIEKKSQENM